VFTTQKYQVPCRMHTIECSRKNFIYNEHTVPYKINAKLTSSHLYRGVPSSSILSTSGCLRTRFGTWPAIALKRSPAVEALGNALASGYTTHTDSCWKSLAPFYRVDLWIRPGVGETTRTTEWPAVTCKVMWLTHDICWISSSTCCRSSRVEGLCETTLAG